MHVQADAVRDQFRTTTTASMPKASETRSAGTRWPGDRAIFLAQASKQLGSSIDLEQTVRCMTELSVPELGPACLVCLLDDEHFVTQVTTRHVDPRRQDQLAALGRVPIGEDGSWEPVLSVARSRQPALLPQRATAALLRGLGSPQVVVSELGLNTALLVPVVDRNREHTQAVVVFLSDRPRRYGIGQLRLAQELVSRFSLALEVALMYRACQSLLDDRQETLATTVHDLMSPLTYIKGTAQRLRRLEDGIADPPTRSELRTRLEAIDSAVNRIQSALTGLLQTGVPSPEDSRRGSDTRVDLADLVRHSVAEHQLMARHHSVRIGEAPTSLVGTWDGHRLERMLGNLIGNAIKYSPPGSTVEVNLACEEDSDGRWGVLRVIDQGVGIPAGDLPFVFEPFHRGSNVGSTAGTGLGLASVWQTVKMHDGRLWLNSEPGKGTGVTVRLPLECTTAATSSGH
jgi:signal transduction histidine kinase